mmetsp:Transcript_12068/g.25543  ORF Transcript_12068/g.25543 Transcript_12068/m.25543 type:complete len:450 (-) Transcript_12068:49-1398(-)
MMSGRKKKMFCAAIALIALGSVSGSNSGSSRYSVDVVSNCCNQSNRPKKRQLVINSLTCKQEPLINISALRPAGVPIATAVTATRKAETTETASSSSSSSPRSLRLILLVLMVLQNSATVLVGRHTRSRPRDELFEISSFIIVCELLKLLLSCIFEGISSGGHLLQSIRANIFSSRESLLILVPSLLYLVQNSLQHVALSNLSAPVFQVTYQFKLVTTALASAVFLNRKYAAKQWICLFSLGIGVATVVLGERVTVVKEAVTDPALTENHHVQSIALGLVAVSTACISSALASVSLERMLKATSSKSATSNRIDGSDRTNPTASLWLRNIELATFSLCIATARHQHSVYGRSGDDMKPFLHGFSGWVYLLLALQAGGGLLVAAVMKYADNVLKGLATGVSVIVSSAGSAALFGTPINTYFTIGASTILMSVYLFSNDLPWAKGSGSNGD